MHKCIYCLQEKEDDQFNKEHVVPQMMGKYNNGYVLSHNQVCQECNSYFCNELENKIGLDSFEAFLRTQYRSKPLSDGHTLRKQRLQVSVLKMFSRICRLMLLPILLIHIVCRSIPSRL